MDYKFPISLFYVSLKDNIIVCLIADRKWDRRRTEILLKEWIHDLLSNTFSREATVNNKCVDKSVGHILAL